MAEDETRDDDWGNMAARVTFIGTIILAALFVGAVVVFIH